MKKLVLSVALASVLASPVLAQLGQTRSQIEAKYGKNPDPSLTEDITSWPASIKGRDGKLFKRPPEFYSHYRSHKSNIEIHYNDKGIVTEVWYRCSHLDQYTEADLGVFLEQNGFREYQQPTSYAYQFYRNQSQLPGTWFELQPSGLNRPGAYLAIEWADADGDPVRFHLRHLSGDDRPPKVIEIRFMTLEGFAEMQKSCDRCKRYADIVQQVTGHRPN